MPVPKNNQSSQKKASKVDERIKAAEARRTELLRAKEEQAQQKQIMRRDRLQSSKSNSGTQATAANLPLTRGSVVDSQGKLVLNVFLQFSDGRVVRSDSKSLSKLRGGSKLKLKLFTIAQVERLLSSNDLCLVEFMLGIMRGACSSKHPIQNKFLLLQQALRQARSRRTSFCGSISPIESPSFAMDMDDLRTPGSSMDILHRDGDGLLSIATIDEITTRHNLSPVKGRTGYFSKVANAANASNNFNPNTTNTRNQNNATSISATAASANNNFLTVLSPTKRRDAEENAVLLTPTRKSTRLQPTEEVFNEQNVANLLLNDDNLSFVSNPYIPLVTSSKAKSPAKRARLSDSSFELAKSKLERNAMQKP